MPEPSHRQLSQEHPHAFAIGIHDVRTGPPHAGELGEGLLLRTDRGDIQAILHQAPEAQHVVIWGNLVNTSVTSVDTSADCASGRGMLASTDTLKEPQLLCRKKPLRLVYQGRGAIEHQGFLRIQREQRPLR